LSPPVELPTPGLRERKKERTRETIRARALHLFVTQGYQATTVQQIIDDVGVVELTHVRLPGVQQLPPRPMCGIDADDRQLANRLPSGD